MKKALLILLLSTTLFAVNNYNKGVDAYKHGDYKTALSYWMPYAMDNNAQAQYFIANIYYDGKGDIEQNYIKALKWYKKASANDYAKAQLKVGMMYAEGLGVLKSYTKAAPYIQSAFDNGCIMAPEVWKKYELWKYE